ncbi:MAG TPA: DUF3048 domain-containing protein [Actinomycetes bacterium]|nr:DUF3048 domain-containing protein [Actinomycetes bacterium]
MNGSPHPTARRGRLVALVVGALAVVVACSSPGPTPAVTSPAPGPSTAASPTPTPADTSVTSPLTGEKVPALAPVLVVKIGNTPPERPPIGLEAADVVYVEMVEGGLTRYAAVFSSELPERVGPVRSARETDIELLGQYGAVGLAFSGAESSVVSKLRRSSLQLVSFDASIQGFRRDRSRGPAPYNVVGTTAALLKRADNAAVAHDVGFRFGEAPPGGQRAASMSARYSAARVGATWDAGSGRWLMSMDGRASVAANGARLGAPTVIVQYVTETTLGRRDAAGSRVPFAKTVGAGAAVVLRDGMSYDARWSRSSAGAPTTWTFAGAPMPLAAGPVWVLLVPANRPVQLR